MLDGDAAQRLAAVKARITAAEARFGAATPVTLVAVSKTFAADEITPFLHAGQRVFGENRVQEAQAKWPALRVQYPDVSLHLIGPLQTNKVREAVALFDVIETVDRDKLAGALAKEMALTGRPLPCLVQVNIGEEPQKAGIRPAEAAAFVLRCREVHGLKVEGLMCIPPADLPPGPFFAQLATLGKQANTSYLSMGMSGDFEPAIWMGATHVRLGSVLFGTRQSAATLTA